MCGIAGIVGLESDDRTQERMLKTLARRGPDGRGIYSNYMCCLLHSRLAVIDPEGGAQPMGLHWAGEQYVLVYNGELYNTEQIREELIKLGHCFVGHSDTEVVLHAYACWGAGCLEKFNGIFAFAVWEEKERRLFLARDRMGVKPLFYMRHGSGLLFGSEIKSILAYPSVRAELDITGAAEIMLLGPGRTPGCGVFRGISELEPGCCGYYESGKLIVHRYWKLKDREHRESFDETVECVRYLVTDAIRRQMISDVPLGTFLSGGLDSSLISAVCNRELTGKKIDTFSLDYVDNERYFQPGKFQPNSDTAFIERMKRELDTVHHWTVLTPEALVGTLEDATVARDLPGMADVDFSLLAFCREIRKEVTVALSGECADEIFGGYPWYRDPEIRAAEGFPWSQNLDQRMQMAAPSWKENLDGADYLHSRYQDTCTESDVLPGTSNEERRMKEMVNLNLRWFMQTLLERKDRMSMYSGLEVRVPFCDYRIAEYLYGVPWEMKNYRNTEKGLLRMAARDLLPDEILWRKKSPYPKTHHPQYRQLVLDRLRLLLEDRNAPVWNLVDRSVARSLTDGDLSQPWYGQLMQGPQTMAYLLQINFWLDQYQIDMGF